jgi:hypothetical protein
MRQLGRLYTTSILTLSLHGDFVLST